MEKMSADGQRCPADCSMMEPVIIKKAQWDKNPKGFLLPACTDRNVLCIRLLKDQVNNEWATQIVNEVKGLQDNSFMNILELIKQINPVRYGNLDAVYLQQFIACCGIYIVFALENPQYLFLLMTSASYKTKLTSCNMNKLVGTQSKKCITQLISMV